jgi:CMP-N,N'-diacetyllegionaminic acid synthase
MRVAIIPARKGSSRAPGKNTAMIGGVSLIERAVQQAIRTGLYDKVIVSSDDPEILNLVRRFPVLIDERMVFLAGDNAPLIAVLTNLICKYGIPADAVVSLLVVTNPLRTDQDIKDAHKVFEASDRQNTLVSVCEVDYPVEMTWKLNNNLLLSPSFDTPTTRKQDFSPSYRWNDAIVIDTAGNFISEDRKLFGSSPLPFFMPPKRSLYIDYSWQMDLIQLIIENQLETE